MKLNEVKLFEQMVQSLSKVKLGYEEFSELLFSQDIFDISNFKTGSKVIWVFLLVLHPLVDIIREGAFQCLYFIIQVV